MVAASPLRLACLGTLALSALATGLDVRVSPAQGIHGRDMIRLSVIDNTPSATYGGYFDYNSNFKGKWEEYALHSKLVKAEPGSTTRYLIPTPKGKVPVDVRIPSLKNGTNGILFGDPCVWETGFVVPCVDDVGPRLSNILNNIGDHIDYWMILGDNFYDQKGDRSGRFFRLLDESPIKQIPLLTTPGNHDYWLLGTPDLGTFEDQYAHGFMQYYAQDAQAGAKDTTNFLDFSGSSDKPAPMSNFQQYKQLGNTGFLVYSSVYTWEEQLPFFTEACKYFGSEKPSLVVLAAHWSSESDGAAPGMDVREARKKIIQLPGCQIGAAMKGVFGHTHCNKVIDSDNYMIGGSGFAAECSQAGFVWVNTQNDQLEVVEYEYGHKDKYDALIACLPQHGPAGCTHLGNTWVKEALPAQN